MFKNRKGFTLIELLIVIAIIGILAVAFLPTILGAPAKGRDTQRVADLQKIQKILVDYNLREGIYPHKTGSINGDLDFQDAGGDSTTWAAEFQTLFGGTIPSQPAPVDWTEATVTTVEDTEYLYLSGDNVPAGYNFALATPTETFETANTNCDTVNSENETTNDGTPVEGKETTWCYVIMSQ